MAVSRIVGWVGFLLAAAALPAEGGQAEQDVAITVVNYSRLPVHSTAVSISEKDLCDRLGFPAGTPLRVRAAGGTADVPINRSVEDGRPVVRLHVALPPESRLNLSVRRADRWPVEPLASACCEKVPGAGGAAQLSGEMTNGLLRVTFAKGGWSLSFDPPGRAGPSRPVLIENGALDFWIDGQNRGRIVNSNPRDLGLASFATARLESCEASVGPDGQPCVKAVSRMDGVASRMKVTEIFELVPGMPLLNCRVRWHNEGDTPLWVAYVGSGDGIRGRWSRSLLPVPLIERKKSPLLGDINGSETRCAWLGGLCRISMESPATGCGVGMSTLLPTPARVGTGSMVWGCGGSGFQCNFIDPVKGQFPFRVEPGGTLENGISFLAAQSGTSVFRQTVDLWKALQAGSLPRLGPPCAVFVDGRPVEPQTVSAMADVPGLLVGPAALRQAALRMDFNRHFQCRVAVQAEAPGDAVEIIARPMSPKKEPLPLLRADRSGNFSIDLNAGFGAADEVPFVLEAKTIGAARLKGLSIEEILPLAPEPLSPVPDASVTDFATMFRWKAIPMVVDYDLEWTSTPDFAKPQKVRLSDSDPFPRHLPADDGLPAPGIWHWRVRGIKGTVTGPWSAVRRFTVNNDHSTRPPRRPLTPENPLFTLEATRVLDFTAFRPDVPADIAPAVGIIAEGFEAQGIPVTDFARGMEKLPHPILLRSHWVGLADIEWLFQNVPNFAGIQGGEHLSDLYRESPKGEMRYAHRLTRLCAKYGMIYQEADGTYKDDKWQDLMDRQGSFVREHGRWLVLTQKNNIIRRQFYSQSAAMGLWLGGITHQHGAWEDGGFYWQNAGFNGLGRCEGERSGKLETMPRIFWSLVGVMGIGRGCGIYSLDGQTLMYSAKAAARDPRGAWPSALWEESGRTTDTFKRFVVPLIRGTRRHGLIPSREQVLNSVRLAVYNDRKAPGDPKAWPHYVEYGPLYAGTYGFRKMGDIDGQLWEFFPNTGRYYYIPVLVQGNEPLAPAIRNLPVSELQEVERVTATFNAAYPAWYEGDALVTRAGDTLTVLNSRENEDVSESYATPLRAGPVTRLAGRIGPHSFLVGKIEDSGRALWLQANTEYPDRDTQLSVSCSRRPEWTVEPASASREASWNEAEKTLNLRLSHREGAVEVTLK